MRGDNGDQVRDLFRDANIPRIPRGVLVAGIVVLVVISIVLTIFYQVEADEVAVVQRFGKYVRLEEPGLRYRLPFGIETVRKVKTRRVHTSPFGFRTEEEPNARPRTRFRSPPLRTRPEESLILTGDLNVADVEWIVQYRIADPVKYLFGSRNPGKAHLHQKRQRQSQSVAPCSYRWRIHRLVHR